MLLTTTTMARDIVYRLPKSLDDDVLRIQSRPSRLIRLRSLQSDPTHFLSKYDVEIKYKEELWLSRLRDPHVQHFVLVTVDDNYDDKGEISLNQNTEFHGMMVVINEYEEEQAECTKAEEGDKIRGNSALPTYFLGCLYMDTSFRSQGWGTKIIQKGIEWVRQDARSKGWPSVRYRVVAMDGNDRAVNLYLKIGFKIDGVKIQGNDPGDVHTELSMII